MALFGKNFIIAFIRPRTDFFFVVEQDFNFDRACLGESLKRCRMGLDYSLRDLAKLSGVSASHILRIESGEYDFQVETLLKIAIHLGVPCGLLLEEGLAVNWLSFHALVQADPALVGCAPKGLKPGVAGPWLEAVRFVAVECAVTTKLLWSSNPSMLATRFDYPFSHLEDGFIKAAATIEQTHSADRAAMLRQLRKAPVTQLVEFGVLGPKVLSEYLSLLNSKSIVRWNGFPNPLDRLL